MVQYITTPWRSHCDLLLVRSLLYPTTATRKSESQGGGKIEIEGKKQAVAKILVWVQRGNCPHLIESTGILMAAVLNDEVGDGGGGGGESFCVRAAYAGAFSRFVTGLLDSHQTKQRKISMYSIASSIGLPATYVELRHQATHEELPSLQKLRTAARKALYWIWEYYWVHLQEKDVLNKGSEECKGFVMGALEEEGEVSGVKEAVRRWGEGSLLSAVLDVQAGKRDTAFLQRCLRFQKSILNSGTESEVSKSTSSRDLDMFRSEIAAMEQNLGDSIEENNSNQGLEVKMEGDGEGWTLYEGPWVPKPIGVI